MAYDLLFRRQTPRNWSLHSYLCDYSFAPDPTPTTQAEQALIARLAVLKMGASAGNKRDAKKWRAAMAKIVLEEKKAARGDARAMRLMKILKESGLFSGVATLDIAGIDPKYHHTILNDIKVGRSMYSPPHRSKHYYRNPVQKTDKYKHTHTVYR